MIRILFLLALLSVLRYASASIDAKRGSGMVVLPVTATSRDKPPSIFKRQQVSTVENVQTGTRYMVDFYLGTPPQPVSLAIDTGSSETWVNPQCSTSGAQSQIGLCNSFPVYHPNSSTTATNLRASRVLMYGKGTANVAYYDESFQVGAAKVVAQKFGVAVSSTEIPTGLLGIGPGIELTGYPTIIDSLKAQGFTNSRAFSLDLRAVSSPVGAIIFGGIDTMKYRGTLEKCPIIPAAQSPDGYDRYWIYMTSVGITMPGQTTSSLFASSNPSDENGQPVFLDSGGTLSALPPALAMAIINSFPGATEESGSGVYRVDCALTTQNGSVDFGFGTDKTIHVPFSEFIWTAGPSSCYIGVYASDGAPVLGDSFLRAAYVVYDQDNQNLLLAEADDCGTNLVPIGSGPDAVPSIVGACGASSTSASITSTSTSDNRSSSTFASSRRSSTSTQGSSTPTPSLPSSISTSQSSSLSSSSSGRMAGPSRSSSQSSTLSTATSHHSTEVPIFSSSSSRFFAAGSLTVDSASSTIGSATSSTTPSSLFSQIMSSLIISSSFTSTTELFLSTQVAATPTSTTGSLSISFALTPDSGSWTTAFVDGQTVSWGGQVSTTSLIATGTSAANSDSPSTTLTISESFPTTATSQDALKSSSETSAWTTAVIDGKTVSWGGPILTTADTIGPTKLSQIVATLYDPDSPAATPVSFFRLETSEEEWVTSTILAARDYTITSCAPHVTNCPSVTTDAYPISTASELVEATSEPEPELGLATLIVYATSIYTITSCAPTVTDCLIRVGSISTELIPLSTTIITGEPLKTDTGPEIKEASPPLTTSTQTIYATTTYAIAACGQGRDCDKFSTTTQTIPMSTAVTILTIFRAPYVVSNVFEAQLSPKGSTGNSAPPATSTETADEGFRTMTSTITSGGEGNNSSQSGVGRGGPSSGAPLQPVLGGASKSKSDNSNIALLCALALGFWVVM